MGATTSMKALFDPNTGKVIMSYTHFDGYPSYMGKLLTEHYADEERARLLISMGPASSIGPYIDPKEAGYSDEEAKSHSFVTPLKDVSVFYGRDRGEENSSPVAMSDMTPEDLRLFLRYEYRWIPILWLGILDGNGKVTWYYGYIRDSNPVWYHVDGSVAKNITLSAE